MSARRSKFQLSVEVLQCIRGGEAKPTRIMYNCNLKDILQNLTEQGLVEELEVPNKKRSKKHYAITPKGENVLKYYSAVTSLIQIEDLD